MMAVVVAPAALLTLLLAYSLFGSAIANMQTTQAAAAGGRAAAIRVWLEAAGRSLANEAAAAVLLAPERCVRLAQSFLSQNPGFASIRLYDQEGGACEAGQKFETPPGAGKREEGGYRLADATGRLWILADAGPEPSVLVVDGAALRERLRVAPGIGETHLALIGPSGETLAQDSELSDVGWRLAELEAAEDRVSFRAHDQNGAKAAYALAPLGSGFRLLLRFDDGRYEAAWRRFLVLCFAQLAMLGLLAYVYARAIRRDVVRWIEGIDVAVRARGGDPGRHAAAPVSARMPQELRNVAQSFNAMAEDAAERQRKLESSLAENRVLMLEMHHRIKNSLQVIQSYLALIRRNGPRAEAPLLARIEARVGVLAVAYRLALTPTGIRPIRVKPFLDEIFAAASGGLRRPSQRVHCAISWDGELIVDRAIPLGLALVEALIAALDALDVRGAGVQLSLDGDAAEIRVEADGAPAAVGLPDKVMRGLAAQLGATPAPQPPGVILAWRFVP